MGAARDIQLPDWPALMSVELAAAYVGLSPDSFQALAARKGLRAVDLGLRALRWRRRDLDALIDRLPVRGERAPLPAPDLADQALQLVARRVGR